MKYLYLLLLISLWSCQKESVEIQKTVEATPFYFRMEARDTMHEAFQPVDYTLGQNGYIYNPENGSEYVFPLICGQDLAYRGDQLVLQTGIYSGDDNIYGRDFPLFGFEFALPGLQPGRLPARALLEEYFTVGRSFEAGLGPDKVNLLMRMQIDNPVMTFPSQSVYLYEPTGKLTIIAVEDYTYEYQMPPYGMLRGKRVTCQFEGAIGRYNVGNHWDEFPNTDVAVEIRNGEAAFFVQYE